MKSRVVENYRSAYPDPIVVYKNDRVQCGETCTVRRLGPSAYCISNNEVFELSTAQK